MLYLLDTNILSDLIRNPQGAVSRRIAVVGEENICTSIVVAAELRYGAAKKSSQRLTENIESILGAIEVLPLEQPSDAAYGQIRAALEAQGQLIGANDLFIAAQAKSLDAILVTDNQAEFARIEGLPIENWLR